MFEIKLYMSLVSWSRSLIHPMKIRSYLGVLGANGSQHCAKIVNVVGMSTIILYHSYHYCRESSVYQIFAQFSVTSNFFHGST